MAKEGYSANVEWSSRPLNKIEKLMFSQSPDAIPLDKATADRPVYIDVDYVVLVNVHNERNNGDKDYSNTYVMAKDGNLYKTSSESFTTNITDIADMLAEELNAGEDFPVIKAFSKPSKTRSGQHFITCTVHAGPIPQDDPLTPDVLEPVDPAEVPNFG